MIHEAGHYAALTTTPSHPIDIRISGGQKMNSSKHFLDALASVVLSAILAGPIRAQNQGQPPQAAGPAGQKASQDLIKPKFKPIESDAERKEAVKLPTCSYVGINGNCKITISRRNPVTPPASYVKHGSHVTVYLGDALPFEKPVLVLKSTSEAPKTDQLAAGLPTIIQALSTFQVSTLITGPEPAPPPEQEAHEAKPPTPEQNVVDMCPGVAALSFQQITACQKSISDYLATPKQNLGKWALKAVCMLRPLFLPQGWKSEPVLEPAEPCTESMKDYMFPLSSTLWNDKFQTKFDDGNSAIIDLYADFKAKVNKDLNDIMTNLDMSIEDSKGRTIDAGQYLVASAQEADMKAALAGYADLVGRMKFADNAVDKLQTTPGIVFGEIPDRTPDDKNNVTPVWDLNFENRLSDAVALIKADKTPSALASQTGKLTDPPPATTLVEFTIKFVNPPAFEISGGVVIPIKSYHTYAVSLSQQAANAPAGSCPAIQADCGTVTVTRQLAFAPDAIVSRSLFERAYPRGRLALLFSGLVGYNTATTSALLGGGPSVGFGSLVLNIPVVADRDQVLTGGYTLGGSAGAATSPVTKTVWRFSPALGISLRVPLGGGS